MEKRGGGTYSLRVRVRDVAGNVRMLRVTGRTQQEVRRKAAAVRTQSDAGTFANPGRLTVSAYLEAWLDHQASRVRPTTLSRYRSLIRTHVLPVIGSVPLGKIRAAHVQSVLDRALAGGSAPRSVLHVYRCLHTALRQAVRWQLLAANPAEGASPPRPGRPDLEIPDPATVARVLAIVDGERYGPAFVLLAHTGLRRGELLALRWSEVDLDAGALRVVASMARVDRTLVTTAPKSARSRRTVRLGATAVEVLRAVRVAQNERRLFAGPGWDDRGLVFDSGAGSPIDPAQLSIAFKQAATTAGVPRLRLHDLRHAYATALLAANVNPKIVSEALGHASVGITLDTYSHVLPSMGDVAAEAIERAFARLEAGS